MRSKILAFYATNVRVAIPSVNRRAIEITNLFETLEPFVPSREFWSSSDG